MGRGHPPRQAGSAVGAPPPAARRRLCRIVCSRIPIPTAIMPSAKATGPSLDLTADLHKWRAFVAIAELGSITRAALHLDQDQSVLSRRINALERECNARLFNRTGRGVHLSEVGERLFPLVRTLPEDAERLELEVNGQAREPAGEVTLGLLPSTAHPLIRMLFSRQIGRAHV